MSAIPNEAGMQTYSMVRDLPAPSRPWWARLARECAAADCPHRKKYLSAWLRRPVGVTFEGKWYCQPKCFRAVLELRVRNLLSGFRPEKLKNHRLPLGLLLVSRGIIDEEQLRRALYLQRASGKGRVGEWFCKLGFAGEQQIAAALAQQWGCPMFPLDHETANGGWYRLLPPSLLDSARAVPVHASVDGSVVHLAFGDRLDHLLLYAVEQLLGCRAVACVAPEAGIAELLGKAKNEEKTETCFDTIRDPGEMVSIICNYATELGAERVALARASVHLWLRFYGNGKSRDLLFRVLPDSVLRPPLEATVQRTKAFLSLGDGNKGGVTSAPEPI
jgi:hypothetical protein